MLAFELWRKIKAIVFPDDDFGISGEQQTNRSVIASFLKTNTIYRCWLILIKYAKSWEWNSMRRKKVMIIEMKPKTNIRMAINGKELKYIKDNAYLGTNILDNRKGIR